MMAGLVKDGRPRMHPVYIYVFGLQHAQRMAHDTENT